VRRAGCRVVLFQGWLGTDRGLVSLIHSIHFWPQGSILVLIGPVAGKYKTSLLDLAARSGSESRLVSIDMVPFQVLNGLIAGAHRCRFPISL
jgi:hypothetical protein